MAEHVTAEQGKPEPGKPDAGKPGERQPEGGVVHRIPAAGAVIRDESARLLLVQRRHEPGAGLWSLPGGRIEPGETDQQAVVREVAEETGLVVACGRLAGVVERPAHAAAVFEIRDYLAVVIGGELAAGDDAADARWVAPEEVLAMDAAGQLTSGLAALLLSWAIL